MALKGGDKMTAYLERLAEKLGDGTELRVGFLEGATYPDGTSVAMVAAVNEFGNPAKNQPPRPFFRDVIAVGKIEWGEKMKKVLEASKNNVDVAFRLMGEGIKGEIQDAIRYFDDPPIKQETIDKKGFPKALIDTGHMLNSVDYEVTDGNEE